MRQLHLKINIKILQFSNRPFCTDDKKIPRTKWLSRFWTQSACVYALSLAIVLNLARRSSMQGTRRLVQTKSMAQLTG